VVTAACVLAGACQDDIPTSVDNGLVPVAPTTVEIVFAADSFATGFRSYGGFGVGNASRLGGVLSHVALDFGGDELEVRTLAQFGAIPPAATVQDSTGASVSDSTLTLLSGSLLLTIDTTESPAVDSMEVLIDEVTEAWDPGTVSWELATDSVGVSVPWSVAGGGARTLVTSAQLDLSAGLDTLRIPLDSATVARWTDTTDATRGALLRTTTAGARLPLRVVSLTVEVRPGSNPDTTIFLAAPTERQTFIYDPLPTPDSAALWVGGSPAWRSVFEFTLPTELNGPEALCSVVPCPVALTAELLTSASLILTTVSPPTSFLLADSLRFDARPVLAPDLLPRAPVGGPLSSASVILAPSDFSTNLGREIIVPLTAFVQILLDGADANGSEPPSTVALVAAAEPSSLGFAAFAGPGAPQAPRLRLVLTVPEPAGIR